ncbi:MAG: hypothetical protein DI538_13905 [Azospira oryzae]|jgi:ribosome-associated translation inhibitor RaiA|nr:MAG: hypothetical protein DI538_13905 [Azospira oryzae]
MIFQFNTDRTIHGDQQQQEYFETLITQEINRYRNHISRIDVHLSDENGNKKGGTKVRCLLEAQILHNPPIVVIDQSNTVDLAVAGALRKLKTSLERIHERYSSH